MEGGSGPSTINSNPAAIKAAQEGMGKLDILVCGQCHSVFHFIEEFQEHRNKDDACAKVSRFKDNVNNEQKAQVWAFLLWKGSQITNEEDKDTWKIYQQWCTMDSKIRESWIAAGKTIQTFTKISTANMTDVKQDNMNTVIETTPGGKTMIVRKIIRNGQPEESSDIKKDIKIENKISKEISSSDQIKKEKFKLKPSVKPKLKQDKTEGEAESDEEYIVEKILAKRYNPKKRCSEYLLKWEGYAHEYNTWESAESVATCKALLDEFEKNLAKQKEIKAAQQQNTAKGGTKHFLLHKSVVKSDTAKPEAAKPGPSTAAQAGRPMRSSKTKAMDQVKQWCGSMKDEENELLGKRRTDFSDSDSDVGAAKRNKLDTGSDEDWTAESEEDKVAGRSDVIQRAFSCATMPSNGSNRKGTSTEIVTLGLQSPTIAKSGQTPVLVADAKGVVKVDPKQMPNLTSGVYVMSRKDGIIKLDSSPSNKIAVKGSPMTPGVLMVQNRDGTNIVRKQVLSSAQGNSTVTPIKVFSKPDGTQVLTHMKVVSKNSPVKTAQQVIVPKTEPVKIQPKPDPSQMQQIHVVTAVQSHIALQPRLTSTALRPATVSGPRGADNRPLLPRPTLRGASPGSVLSNTPTSVRSPIRANTPRQTQPARATMVQKRVSTGGPLTTVQLTSTSPSTITQIKSKNTVLGSPTKQVQKVTASPVQVKTTQKTPISKPQSLISPQQKLLMAKRKAQEQAGIVKTPSRGLLTGARTASMRGRGKPIDSQLAAQSNKPKESKLAQGDGLHMEFHQVGSESSSEDEPEIPPPDTEPVAPVAPDSPPQPFTLCPLTGRIIGPDGEPVEQPEPETTAASAVAVPTTTVTSSAVLQSPTTLTTLTTVTSENTTNSGATAATTELVLPNLDALTESGGIMRVEMSPGGTTGTIVQTTESGHINLSGVTVAAPDLPCLDDTVTTSVTPTSTTETVTLTAGEATTTTVADTAVMTAAIAATTATSSNVASIISAENIKTESKSSEEKKVEEDATAGMVTITGDDGIVYRVTGEADDGQTLLVTQDGTQQCVYVATTEHQGEEGSVLTLDTAVAEAVAQLMPDPVNLTSQFYVKEGGEGGEQAENQMVMSIMDETGTAVAAGQEDGDEQAQVVAQVVQADEPTPGGTRRVVLLLPDGNLMMTEVDEAQYAALELDK